MAGSDGWLDSRKPAGSSDVGSTLQSGASQCLHWSMIVDGIEVAGYDRRLAKVLEHRFS
jgi:hypothetical protein